MKRLEFGLEPELEALLNPRRIERIAPADVRSRALARARAIVAAGGRIPPRASLELLTRASPRPLPGRSSVRFVLPASFAAAAVAVGAVTALRSPPARVPTPALSAAPTSSASDPIEGTSPESQTTAPQVVTPPKLAHSAARSEREVGNSELELLARAQAAYSHRDFARAISLINELTRRFPNGHLAEEREALRVRSLFGLGSADEGGRAAAAFASRFPRSVLLPKEGRP